MTVQYCCSHLDDPQASLPPSYPSSSSSYHPLPSLYFCEECDAIRCNLCVGVEIASYFCPDCLFDVPSASVRADRNRCARNCFSCPRCESSLAVQASEKRLEDGSLESGPPYILACGGCRWTSVKLGWKFEKPTGLAAQLQKINTQPESIQTEFDALKDHLEGYITTAAPVQTPRAGKGKQPSRHISHLTQMAAKALGRDVPGMMSRPRRKDGVDKGKEKAGWDELEPYKTEKAWKGSLDMEQDDRAGLEMIWSKAWAGDLHGAAKSVLPERIRLQTKLTKRCPEASCRHLLIQPDTKSTRFKIKMVAMSYLPAIELGRRRHRISLEQPGLADTAEDLERRRRDRRRTRVPAKEEDESMTKPLIAGEIYTFQLAFINPLFDPIQIRLTPANQKDPHASCLPFVPVPHFTVNALKDAWAYDEEEEEEHGSEGHSEEGSSTFSGPTKSSISGPGTIGKKSRLSVLGGLGGGDRKRKDHGVERKGNISKVGVEVEILPGASGVVEADMEIRYTYRADEAQEGEDKGKEAFKTFTFWIRVGFGTVEDM